MSVTISGDTGVSKVQDGVIVQADLASGVAGNGPAFSAYPSGNQAISGSTYTKVQFQTELFDTANCFDNATNYRFTPNVAGYYQITSVVAFSGTTSWLEGSIYKNGAGYGPAFYRVSSSTSIANGSIPFNALIYMNGTTDYLELYIYSGGSAITLVGGNTVFSGALLRAA